MGECPESKKDLANLLAACFDIFPLYGRDPGAVGNIRRGFGLVLYDYPIEKIRDAFKLHLKRSKDFPVPADIANIIERNGKPPFERAVYVSISRKSAEDRSSDEWAYMRDYERYQVEGR